MSGRTKALTLEQRIQQGVARRQFTFDSIDSQDQHLHCNWCSGSLLIDYFTFGVPEMTRMLNDFTKQHSSCEPSWKTKTKDMVLTPKGRVS